jgi:ABC-type polysaccharide/polyol phosphate transport system ATPase subunit
MNDVFVRPAIRVSGLTKIYAGPGAGDPLRALIRSILRKPASGSCALDGIEFTVDPGQALGVVGRNGSGKSTLLKILAGALGPTRGTVELQGRIGTLLDLGLGINPDYTGEENVLVLGMLAGLSRREVRDRVDAIRRFSGLGEAFDRPVKTYSSGMTLRLGFSAAIHADPEILLIDEALAVGDAFFQQRCLRKMRALREEGVTIVLVSHDPSAVLSLCDRALWLEQGRISAMGRPDEVIKRYLAARYRDDCALGESLASGALLPEAEVRSISPARPLDQIDERFGDGRAQIVGFEVRDDLGRRQTVIRPNEPTRVVLTVRAVETIRLAVVGFTLRNRLGDVVAATNTELEGVQLPTIVAGSEFDVEFRFPWPPLVSGPVSLSPAVAEGSIQSHTMCDWIENALIVEVENGRGLFGWMTLQGVEPRIGRPRVLSSPTSSIEGWRKTNGEDEELHVEFALDEP